MKQSSTNTYNFRRVKSSFRNWWPISYNCIIPYVYEHNTKYFIDGCGDYYTTDGSYFGYHPWTSSLELQYYSKGSVTWGTPFDTTTWSHSVSIPESKILQNQFFIYPNPANDIVSLEITNFDNDSYHLEICSITGKKLSEISVTNKSYTFSVSQYTAGIYIFKLFKDNKLAVCQKLIVY
jgi:hypothetical protein